MWLLLMVLVMLKQEVQDKFGKRFRTVVSIWMHMVISISCNQIVTDFAMPLKIKPCFVCLFLLLLLMLLLLFFQ